MAEIDSLEIQIKAQATKANNAIDKLITKLDKLSTSLNSINTSNLNGLANSVNRLSSAMQSMNNVKTADFTRLAKGIEKISTVDTTKINRAASSMNQLSKAFGNIQASSSATAQISELAKGISQLGYKSSTKAIENIPKLATAMQGLMTTLSKAPTVNRNLIDMTNALAKLARTGASSGRAANSLASSLNVFSKSAKSAKINSFSLASAFGKLYASYWLLFRAFHKLGEAIDISSSLTEVENVVRTTFGNYEKMIQDFSKTSIQDFGMSELMAKQVASRFQAMGVAMGFSQKNMANMSLELTKLTADMASFYDMSQTDVARNLQAIFTGETEPLRKYGLDLTQATLKEWALKQGLDADITSMTQAQKAMLRYQYVMQNTAAAQGDFARTADTWHNQITVLTQSFQQLASIIGGALINAFKPFVRTLNQVMQYVIAFAETVTNALGSIFGWQYEVSAGGVAEDWADGMEDFSDATGDAAKNAKKLKNNVLALDELNINSGDNDKSGSGAGGGANKVDKTQGGLVQVDTIFKGYESGIKSLEELGKTINAALNKAMENVDWNKIYEKADNFGKGLANFLNGLISPRLFSNVGKTIANSLNTVLHFLDSFGTTFDWKNFGKSLAAGIKGFFENWDAGLTGKTLSTFAKGILEAMSASLNQLSADETFNTIGQKLVDFVCGIDWGGLAWDLAGFFIACENALVNFPVDFAEGVGQRILDKIFGTDENGESNVKFEIPEGVKNSIGTKFLTLFNPGLGVAKEAIDIINTLIKVNDDLESNVSKVADSIEEKIEFLKSMAFMKWIEIQSWFETDIKPWFSADTWVGIFDGIKEAASTKWDEIKEWWANSAIVTWWNDDVLPWFSLDTWLTLLNNIKESFSTKFGETITKWKTDINTWWTVNVAPWFTKQRWDTMLTKIPEAFKNAFKLAANGAIEFLNGVISGVESLVNHAIDGLKKLAEAASKIPGISFSIDIPNVSLPRIPKFSTGGFPEDGLFMANHNELVGQFSNGKTAVASNEMIVAGIEEAAYRGFSRAYEDNSREANLLSEILDAVREGKEISIDGRSLVSAVEERSNRNGFSFA
jgi:hypothetical protein